MKLSNAAFGIMLFIPLSAFGEETPKQVVDVGVIAPLTLGNADRGQDIVHTLSLLGELRSQASERYAYRFKVEDGRCGAGSSPTTAAQKMINVDKTRFLMTGCSGETLQAGPIAERAGVLTMAVFASHPDVKRLGEYIFRTFPDQERAIKILADEIACLQIDRVGLLSEENSFTQGIKALLTTELKERIASSEDFPAETTDFRTILSKLKGRSPKILYLNAASPATLGNLVKQARELGLSFPIYTFLHPDDRAFAQAAGAAGSGVIYLGVPNVESDTPEFRSFLATFKARFGEPHVEFLVRTTFDAFKALDAGIQAVGADAEKVKEFLTDYRAKGATGEISFDEYGDLQGLEYVLKRVSQDGIGHSIQRCGSGR